MTDRGRAVLPDMGFVMDEDVRAELERAGVLEKLLGFHPLYVRVRTYNVAFYKNRDKAAYERALAHLIGETKKGRMFGEWNDYGRLLDY